LTEITIKLAMEKPILELEGVGKRYRLGEHTSASRGYRTLRDTLGSFFLSRNAAPRREQEFWALRDVSLCVAQGETLGIVGANGAGKSTLLKILSRVTTPTCGRGTIRGRMASLLEVGAGFHPELTGRENVFLNGVLLGMSRREVRAKFDAIVDFAGVGPFLDTPVKRYSSGMYVRLAFAVATHTEPDILIVDEVLAVGDVDFQRRCRQRMQELTRSTGLTTLLVSHNLALVKSLCDRAIRLDQGKVRAGGAVNEVLEQYRLESTCLAGWDFRSRQDRSGEGSLRFLEMWLEDPSGRKLTAMELGAPAVVALQYESSCLATGQAGRFYFAFDLRDENDLPLLNFNNSDVGAEFSVLPQKGVIRCTIPRLPLAPGIYYGNLFCATENGVSDWLQNAFTVEVQSGKFFAEPGLRNDQRFATDYRWTLSDK
jgi:lipopolysaccharide transport system ATP-binding protein